MEEKMTGRKEGGREGKTIGRKETEGRREEWRE